MQGTILVLGANGRFGRLAVQAFESAGWQVLAQARRPLDDAFGSGVRSVPLPVLHADELADAAGAAQIVLNALNPPYPRWDAEALPLHRAAIAVSRRLGATLMLPGNVYNYGSPIPPVLTEGTPMRPTHHKARIRCEMESAMREDGLKSIVVRAGDFFGGPGSGSWMDQAIVKDLARGRIVYPGPRNLAHAWAYLPDLAQTFVRIAAARDRLEPHDVLHFPGYTLTGDELVTAIARAAQRLHLLEQDQPPRLKGLPWTLLRIAGLVNPMLRELCEMRYLWDQPHRLDGRKLERLIGDVPQTPLDAALEDTLGGLPLQARG